jgi:hypothetical protein
LLRERLHILFVCMKLVDGDAKLCTASAWPGEKWIWIAYPITIKTTIPIAGNRKRVPDVVGYSGLVGSDEDRTLARLRALRSDLIDPTVAVHNAAKAVGEPKR